MIKIVGVALSLCVLVGCGSSDDVIASDEGAWTVYPDPFKNGTPNPAAGIKGSAKAIRVDGDKMRVEMTLSGLSPKYTFGSHIHKLACDDMAAGGHYQHTPSPGAANDPGYANPTNEAWLDFTTDDAGAAAVKVDVGWVPRTGEAKSVIVHAMGTAPGGIAGAKLACLPLVF
jgi:hypothetical protein